MEQGEERPTVDALERICDALHVTLSDFFSHETATPAQLKAMDAIRKLSDKEARAICVLAGMKQ